MGRREDFRGKILVRDILGAMGSLFLGSGHSQREKVLLWIFVAWESRLMWTAISLTDFGLTYNHVILVDTSPGWLVDFPLLSMNCYPDWAPGAAEQLLPAWRPLVRGSIFITIIHTHSVQCL